LGQCDPALQNGLAPIILKAGTTIMKLDFTSRSVLVTGAARGIGAAIAAGFAEAGAYIIVADKDEDAAEDTASRIRSTGCLAVSAAIDVTDRHGLATLASRLDGEIAPVSVIVNNAGGGGRIAFDAPESDAAWDRLIGVNLTGAFNVVRAFMPALRHTKGNVINVSSVVAFTSGRSHAGYTASKGGMKSLTQILCREFGPEGIRVNAIAPGYTLTDLTRPYYEAGQYGWIEERCPMGRLANPEEMVGPALFLASDLAGFVNGVTIPVDGGFIVS
jgi:NAD(P)-dependent dehydrogenase (short-subunit alcohol dehydrogenase family)